MSRSPKAAGLAVVGLIVGGLLTPAPARAQDVSVVVAVIFENINGTTVDCDPPEPSQRPGHTTIRMGCDVQATASGGAINNRCQEMVSVSAPPIQHGTAVTGCSVTVSGSLIATSTATRLNDGTVVYECSGGAGVGTAEYNPSSLGAGRPMSGLVFLEYVNGIVTIEGQFVSISTSITAGTIKATGFDPCGPDNLAHPFAGTIN